MSVKVDIKTKVIHYVVCPECGEEIVSKTFYDMFCCPYCNQIFEVNLLSR